MAIFYIAIVNAVVFINQGFINVVPVVGEELSAKYIPCTDKAQTQSAVVTQVHGNILHSNRNAVVFIYQGFINVVPVVGEELSAKYIPCTDKAQTQSAVVTQVMWCTLGWEPVLVITSSLGLQVFDVGGLECRFSHPCADPSPPAESFARGLATICNEFLCVGNASGCVRVFGLVGEDAELVFVDRKQEHSEAITDLAANKDLLVSADEGGSVVLWNLTGEELLKGYSLPEYRTACTGVKLLQEFLLAAYGSGHLRIFSVDSTKPPALMCEVTARVTSLVSDSVYLCSGRRVPV
ncbi:uncharacterized protein LOC124363241 isoform X3 [Homalodisca vitripennis]|uniref:uncharacterized protein LOC124363241 isoform X3 n=1 Tax=Homalodisca vitripennis TaxID=197043 RepID=UPI001EEA5A20|nr:uncharacterized protein LOC124363241 isoform X3 [Homalodisca vitripennis]